MALGPRTFFMVGKVVKRAEKECDSNSIKEAHKRYSKERDLRVPDSYTGPKPSGGVGGTRKGVKCLHAHYAWFLAGGKDPVGAGGDKGLTEKAFFLPGVGTLASVRTARWIKNNVPGVHIPDSIFKRLEGAEDQKKEGQKICTELMQEVKEIEGVSGVHIMAYKQEEVVPEILKSGGLLPRPAVSEA